MTRTRAWHFALGVALILFGILMPTAWYDALPRPSDLPPTPFRGVLLLQLAFTVEGAVLMWAASRRVAFVPIDVAELPLATSEAPGTGRDVSRRTAMAGLIAITTLALVLRVLGINSDLWIDELAPMMEYREYSLLAVVTTYVRSSNHLLNTLLVKASTGVFGEREWAVRLPAVMLGVATIPTMYWVTRLATGRAASLCAALLLAVSYHHVFFSQNARGYSGYLLFSLLSTGFLVRGLRRDRLRYWVGFTAATVLNLGSLLHGGFVLAAHVLVGLVAVIVVWRSGRSPVPLVKRLVVVFGITGFLCFQLYATLLPQAYVVLNQTYAAPASGFQMTSRAFAADFLKGLSEGFGAGLWFGVVPFMAVAAYGCLTLLRRNWALALGLALPLALLAGLVMLGNLAASPRFFLLGVPLAFLAAVLAVFGLVDRALRFGSQPRPELTPRIAVALIVLLALASLASLPRYYRIPKQPYRMTLDYLRAERGPNDLFVFVHNAEKGFRFYGARESLTEGRDFVIARTLPAFDAAAATGKDLVVVTTLERSLAIEHPDLQRRIVEGWLPVRRFPATIHDGGTTVWRHRSVRPPRESRDSTSSGRLPSTFRP
jgi:mannosyltransferase